MYTQSGRWKTSIGKGGGRVGGGLVRQSSEESNAQNRNSDFYSGSPTVQGNIMDYYRPSEYPRIPDTKIDSLDNSDATTPPSPSTPPSSSAVSRWAISYLSVGVWQQIWTAKTSKNDDQGRNMEIMDQHIAYNSNRRIFGRVTGHAHRLNRPQALRVLLLFWIDFHFSV